MKEQKIIDIINMYNAIRSENNLSSIEIIVDIQFVIGDEEYSKSLDENIKKINLSNFISTQIGTFNYYGESEDFFDISSAYERDEKLLELFNKKEDMESFLKIFNNFERQ